MKKGYIDIESIIEPIDMRIKIRGIVDIKTATTVMDKRELWFIAYI